MQIPTQGKSSFQSFFFFFYKDTQKFEKQTQTQDSKITGYHFTTLVVLFFWDKKMFNVYWKCGRFI